METKIWVSRDCSKAYYHLDDALRALEARKAEIKKYHDERNRKIYLSDIIIKPDMIQFQSDCSTHTFKLIEIK